VSPKSPQRVRALLPVCCLTLVVDVRAWLPKHSAAATEPDLHGHHAGKKLVVLIGQEKALGIAVHDDRPQMRYSGLLSSLRSQRHPQATACGVELIKQ
jgi:hypothetical protein